MSKIPLIFIASLGEMKSGLGLASSPVTQECFELNSFLELLTIRLSVVSKLNILF